MYSQISQVSKPQPPSGRLVPSNKRGDIITLLQNRGMDHVAGHIFSFLDFASVCQAEAVCSSWLAASYKGQVWKKLLQKKIETDPVWKSLAYYRGWIKYLSSRRSQHCYWSNLFFKKLFFIVKEDADSIENNFSEGKTAVVTTIETCPQRLLKSKIVQFDQYKIVAGLKDDIKVWNRNFTPPQVTTIFSGHTDRVLCLQYDSEVLISGSADHSIRIWLWETSKCVKVLKYHTCEVIFLKFSADVMVSSSSDKLIFLWTRTSPVTATIKAVLIGHHGTVPTLDFDERFIVSGSSDKTIKVWDTDTGNFVRTLVGHSRRVTCLQYKTRLLISGSGDKHIRLWNVERGVCIAILKGHMHSLKAVSFDEKRIISAAYNGEIKVWDFNEAIKTGVNCQCKFTLNEHMGKILCAQFNVTEIITSHNTGVFIIWDFIRYSTWHFNNRLHMLNSGYLGTHDFLPP